MKTFLPGDVGLFITGGEGVLGPDDDFAEVVMVIVCEATISGIGSIYEETLTSDTDEVVSETSCSAVPSEISADEGCEGTPEDDTLSLTLTEEKSSEVTDCTAVSGAGASAEVISVCRDTSVFYAETASVVSEVISGSEVTDT